MAGIPNPNAIGSMVPPDGASSVPTSIATLGPGTLAQLNAAITDADVAPDKVVIIDDATAARSLSDADNNSIIRFTNAGVITVTVPDTLTEGVSIVLERAGAGQVTVVAGGATTFDVPPSAAIPAATAEQYAVVGVTVVDGAGSIVLLDGNLA